MMQSIIGQQHHHSYRDDDYRTVLQVWHWHVTTVPTMCWYQEYSHKVFDHAIQWIIDTILAWYLGFVTTAFTYSNMLRGCILQTPFLWMTGTVPYDGNIICSQNDALNIPLRISYYLGYVMSDPSQSSVFNATHHINPGSKGQMDPNVHINLQGHP